MWRRWRGSSPPPLGKKRYHNAAVSTLTIRQTSPFTQRVTRSRNKVWCLTNVSCNDIVVQWDGSVQLGFCLFSMYCKTLNVTTKISYLFFVFHVCNVLVCFSSVFRSTAPHLLRNSENLWKQATYQVSEQADTKETQVHLLPIDFFILCVSVGLQV